jgi:hypothetical protein
MAVPRHREIRAQGQRPSRPRRRLWWPFPVNDIKDGLQSAEVCLALLTELDTRAALLAFTYELRTVAKLLEHEERKLIARAAPTTANALPGKRARVVHENQSKTRRPGPAGPLCSDA